MRYMMCCIHWMYSLVLNYNFGTANTPNSYKKGVDELDLIRVIFPQIVPNKKTIEHIINTKTISNVSGTYGSVELLNYNLCLVPYNNNEEFHLLLSLINKVAISLEHTVGDLTFIGTQQKDKMHFFHYTIGNTKPYYENTSNNYIINNIHISITPHSKKQFIFQLTKEEVKHLKKLFFEKEELAQMWFIYRNFENLYDKEFVIFTPQGKLMNMMEGKALFLRFLRLYIYHLIYESLY